jgi:PKD repeat protein
MKGRVVLALVLALLAGREASAYRRGVSGYSGNPIINAGLSCELCHGGGGILPTVVLNGPMRVLPGSTNTYTLTISGGTRMYGSLDVSATLGVLMAVEAGTQIMAGELVHSDGKPADGNGEVAFNFQWVAPSSPGLATLYAAGLSSDGGGPNGDETARMAMMVSVDNAPAPNVPPVANPGGPYTGIAGTPLMLDGSMSFDSDGQIVAYLWDFGDGASDTLDKPSHTYAAPGIYTVTLTVTDDDGATGMMTTMANIGVPGNQPPVAHAGGPYSGLVNAAISFDGSRSSDPEGGALTYAWDFGDGTTGAGAMIVHSYAAVGTYPVVLQVTDPDGLSAQAMTMAVVTDPGSPVLIPVTVFAPEKVKVKSDKDKKAKVVVRAELVNLPLDATGCGTVFLYKNDQQVASQQFCLKPPKREHDDDGSSGDEVDILRKNESKIIRLKTENGVVIVPRPFVGSSESARLAAFKILLSDSDAPSVIWTAVVEFGGVQSQSQPVVTAVDVKMKR